MLLALMVVPGQQRGRGPTVLEPAEPRLQHRGCLRHGRRAAVGDRLFGHLRRHQSAFVAPRSQGISIAGYVTRGVLG